MDFCLYLLLSCLCLGLLVHGQDNSDFISIDCGAPDEQFVDTGASYNISDEYKTWDLDPRLANLRSFPQGIRNCYTLRPKQGKNNNYLIRAWFLYGNYDGKNSSLPFDLYIDANPWDRILFPNPSVNLMKEIIYAAPANYINVCVMNISLGTPFISALELRHLNDSIYKSQGGCMVPYERKDMGSYGASNELVGYNDELGRLWNPYNQSYWEEIRTYFPIDSMKSNAYELPLGIMKTAVKPQNSSLPLKYYVDQGGSSTNFYAYFHFCELEGLKDNETRQFDIFLNDVPWIESVVPRYLESTTITKETPVGGGSSGELWISLVKTNQSTLPPILNALEVYLEKKLPETPTNAEDVEAMVNISRTYPVRKLNWQGDPCVPLNLSWEGVNCSSDSNNIPRVIQLNLSSSGLTGGIAASLSGLKSLQLLDLSNNSLTGPVPEFLSELPDLKILNLAWNNLTGSVPQTLLQKSANSTLSLSLDGNPKLCQSVSCEQKKKKSNVVAIVASVASSVVFVALIAILWMLKRRRQNAKKAGRILKSKSQTFSYSDLVRITNNFQRVIGKGGFGTVYLGCLDDGTKVAVKMLSRSSSQGSDQFWTEAELLTTIHHRNLASLIGYCDEVSNTALVYEYMDNGNLQEYLLDRNRAVLSWEQRLRIAVDVAQALEYLHNGCKPPIVHRDIKTANILLNEKLQAKLADFGLSRIFPTEDGSHATHVSTSVVGTFGYLDPEYYITSRLTEKSDVYSFGIVLLELITGQPAVIKQEDNTHIVQWVMPMLERGEIGSIADPRLQGDFDINSAWKALETAMACVPNSAIRRPTMSQVLAELKDCQQFHVANGISSDATENSTANSWMTSNVETGDLGPLDLESSMSCPKAR